MPLKKGRKGESLKSRRKKASANISELTNSLSHKRAVAAGLKAAKVPKKRKKN
jgi:hypothetical protein